MRMIIMLAVITMNTISYAGECETNVKDIYRNAQTLEGTSGYSVAGINSIIKKTIDFRWLAKETLGSVWPGLDSGQRIKFTRLLKKLMAVGSNRKNAKALRPSINWVSRKKSTISTVIVDDVIETTVEINLFKGNKCWTTRDVIVDEVSMVGNYKEQFNTVIKKHGFEGLLRRMEKRAEERERDES